MRILIGFLFITFSISAQVQIVPDTLRLPIRNVTIGVVPKVVLRDSVLQEKVNISILRECIRLGGDESLSEYFSDYEADSLNKILYQEFYGYQVLLNRNGILSLSEDIEGCGAYCETYSSYVNINLITGDPIRIEEILQQKGLEELNNDLTKIKQDILDSAIAQTHREIKEHPEDKEMLLEEIEIYEECSREVTRNEMRNFTIEPKGLSFKIGRCSNHAMRALDELWTISIDVDLAEYETELTELGKKLLYLKIN